ncbi:ABC transporter substrate-binding protein [Rhizocola hellebori]|nr:ABC transporter substrate-binding protein [Rhizocola hellebori]
MIRRFTAVLAGAAMLLSAAACGAKETPPSTPGTPDKVTAGVVAIVDVAPIYLGKQKGFFTEQNIDLTLQTAQGGAAVVPAVAAGTYQFGFSNSISVLVAHTNGVPIKAIASGNGTTGNATADFSGLVVKDPAITSPKALVGKKVATNTLKNIVDTSIKELVKRDGGDPAAVSLVELAFPDMVGALDTNKVDAIFVVEPFLSAAKAKGWKVIGSFAALDPAMCVALYVTSQALAQSNPDLVARFTTAMKKSLAYAESHPDEVRAILGSYTQIAENVRQGMTLPKWPADINRASLDKLADLIVANGLTSKKPDVAAVVS